MFATLAFLFRAGVLVKARLVQFLGTRLESV